MLNFGICFKGDMSPGRTIELAQQAERGGFTYVWTFDSHVLWKDCYVMLTLLAQNTEVVKLGPCVTNPAVRDVTVTASSFATLNIVSGGRAVCGIGRGDSSRRVLGRKPTTVKRMMESVEEIRDLAEGRKVEIEGQEQWLPWANPDYKLPMWLAGYGPKVLKASGAHADGIVLQIADPFLIKWFMGQVRAGAEEAGRNPDDIKFMVAAPVFVDSDLAECRRHVRWFPAMVGNHVADLVTKYHSGEVPAELTSYIEGRKGYDYRQHADKDSGHLDFIPDTIIDRFAIVGDVQNHVARLKELRDLGVDQFNIYLMSDQEERNLEVYCKEVLPEVNKW